VNCPNCGTRISQTAKLCTICANIQAAKVERNSEIYALYKAGRTLAELASQFNLSYQRVSKIIERERINAE
jgi:Mor family transcriptional regulator